MRRQTFNRGFFMSLMNNYIQVLYFIYSNEEAVFRESLLRVPKCSQLLFHKNEC